MSTQFVIFQHGQLVPVNNPYSEEVANFQMSEDWRNFRAGKELEKPLWPHSGFGENKAAQLMDEAHQGNFNSLMLEMSGFKEVKKSNWRGAKRGAELEAEVRAMAEGIFQQRFAKVCAIDTENPVRRVSFGGVAFNEEGLAVNSLTIKIPTAKKYAELKTEMADGKILNTALKASDLGSYSYYYAPIQYQLSFLDVEVAALMIYSPEEHSYLMVFVSKNQPYIDDMNRRLNLLKEKVWETKNGTQDIEEEEKDMIESLLSLKEQKSRLDTKSRKLGTEYGSILKDDLEELFEENDGVVSTGDIVVTRSVKKGAVDWEALARNFLQDRIESGDIDPETFRRAPSWAFGITQALDG